MGGKKPSFEKSSNISFKIAGRMVGYGQPSFIVAEISANHQQKFKLAVKIIEAVAKAGVDAVKIQTSTPDLLTLDSKAKPFIVKGENIPKIWSGKSLFNLYKNACTPWEWHARLNEVAKKAGIILFSTPFGDEAVDYLEEMSVPCYKIASYEALDVPLLRKVAKTKKPVIISEGFYPVEDVEFSIQTLRDAGAEEIAVLHCLSQYSEKPRLEDANLLTLIEIKKRFGVVSGFSDNNGGIEIPIIAATMGASIIEKHVTLRRRDGGLDASFSLEPRELEEMVKGIRRAEKAIGKIEYGQLTPEAKEAETFCRSLFIVKSVKKGTTLTTVNVRPIRPSDGLSPKYWDDIIGKRAASAITAGTPLSWDLIEK